MDEPTDPFMRALLLAFAEDWAQPSGMSWSISAGGTKEQAKESVESQAQQCLTNYPTGLEHDSIERARQTIHAEIDAAPGEKVTVSAYGSFSSRDGKEVAHSFTVSVSSAAE